MLHSVAGLHVRFTRACCQRPMSVAESVWVDLTRSRRRTRDPSRCNGDSWCKIYYRVPREDHVSRKAAIDLVCVSVCCRFCSKRSSQAYHIKYQGTTKHTMRTPAKDQDDEDKQGRGVFWSTSARLRCLLHAAHEPQNSIRSVSRRKPQSALPQ